MFIVTWLFDKLGYMPKIEIEVGKVDAWPFPAEEKKPVAKKVKPRAKAAAKKPAVIAKTARTKKAK